MKKIKYILIALSLWIVALYAFIKFSFHADPWYEASKEAFIADPRVRQIGGIISNDDVVAVRKMEHGDSEQPGVNIVEYELQANKNGSRIQGMVVTKIASGEVVGRPTVIEVASNP